MARDAHKRRTCRNYPHSDPLSVGLGQTQNTFTEVVQNHLLGNGGEPEKSRLTPEPLNVVLLGVAEAPVGLKCRLGTSLLADGV